VTRPLRHGEPWGHTATSPPDIEVEGDDTDLVATAVSRPAALVRFRPTPRSDLARALGLGSDGSGATEVAIDALAIDPDDSAVDPVRALDAVNAVVLGPPPDRLRWTARAADITVRVDGRAWFSGSATTVVVANGQFLRGADLVPRGHPGDGWAEVQVYALGRRARRGMRRRLPSGTHLPHPDVRAGRARRVEIEVRGRRLPVEVDGRTQGRTARLVVTLVPAAIRLLV
jgi:YegS C-terminal NAD kinase beta sandwich-like domain